MSAIFCCEECVIAGLRRKSSKVTTKKSPSKKTSTKKRSKAKTSDSKPDEVVAPTDETIASPPEKKKRGRPRIKKTRSQANYHQDKHNAERYAAHRDIGSLPEIVNEKRRIECMFDFKLFCKTYFPAVFYLDWSTDQVKTADKIEITILKGGLFAIAMPRGSGKTALCIAAMVWATAYAHKRYLYFIGDEQSSADESLLAVKTAWETNDLLFEDFPELAFSLRALEGITLRQKGQLFNGLPVNSRWESQAVRFPCLMLNEDQANKYSKWTVETKKGSGVYCFKSAGVIINTKGIGGGIRGAFVSHPLTGEMLRPDLVLLDDVQTDKSAASPTSVSRIVENINGAVKGLSGPDQLISGIMPCTVIREDDVSDQFLDRMKHPEWKGERFSLVNQWPNGINDEEISSDTPEGRLWNQYDQLRRESLRTKGDISLATEFYSDNRKVMDQGFLCSWSERYNKDTTLAGNCEISAQQHAMNLRLEDSHTFAAEYQNKPRRIASNQSVPLTSAQVAEKVTNVKRNEVPSECQYITSFIDIQNEVLFHATVAWTPSYTGHVIDYGVFPEIGHRYLTKSQAERWCRLSKFYFEHYPNELPEGYTTNNQPKAPFESKIYHGVKSLCSLMLNKVFVRDDGVQMPINRIGIDCNWGKSEAKAKEAIRDLREPRLMPCHGTYVGATSRTFAEYQRKDFQLYEDQKHPGTDHVGWILSKNAANMRHLLVDVNYYKTFVFNRLSTPTGKAGSLTLFHAKPEDHQMIADHVTKSEYPEEVQARGKKVEEWKQHVGKDNDLFDCLVGNVALASFEGCRLQDDVPNKPRSKTKRKLSDIYASKRNA